MASSTSLTEAPGKVEVCGRIRVGRGSHAELRLLHPTVSRSHASIEQSSSRRLLLRDHESRFGTFVNGQRVAEKSLDDGDLVRFGTADSFRVAGTWLVRESQPQGCAIAMRDVRVERRDGTQRPVLVDRISFDIAPNAFVGVLGPSGSGKSTILKALASYNPPAAGGLYFDNGKRVDEHVAAFRRDLGNVPQEDIVFDRLTVLENLLFAARLRFPAGTGADEIQHHAERALTLVDLKKDLHGQPFEKLSGGEKKRVSVALELLERPRLLLLDEPTSGLDPATEAGLMEQLQRIASQGTTVVCTTHHMQSVHLFDTIIVVGKHKKVGRLAYVGPPDDFLPRFGCRNFADAFEKLGREDFDPLGGGAPVQHPTPPPETTSSTSTLVEPPASVSAMIVNGLSQVATLTRRQFLRIWRDRHLVIAMAAQPVVLGVLVAATQFWPLKARVLEFFLCVVAIWLGLNNSARDLVRERRNFVREALTGLSSEAYLAAKCLTFSAIGIVQVLALVFAAMAVAAVTLRPKPWADLVGSYGVATSLLSITSTLFVAYLCGLGLGLIASTLADSEEAAVAALPLLIMPQILLSAVAVGCVDGELNKPRPFKPLVVAFSDGMPEQTWVGRMIDGASLLVYSRPASLTLAADDVEGYEAWKGVLWAGDLTHLVVLLVVTWGGLYYVFRNSEGRWPALIRLG